LGVGVGGGKMQKNDIGKNYLTNGERIDIGLITALKFGCLIRA
jgi:hypothetical protein